MNKIILLFLLFNLMSCTTYKENKPLQKVLKTLEKGGIKQNDIKFITIPSDSGLYYLTNDSLVINEIINKFSVQEDQNCIKLYEESKKWQEKWEANPMDTGPFKDKDKFEIGDILFQIKNKDRLSLLGFSYCKDSKTIYRNFKVKCIRL